MFTRIQMLNFLWLLPLIGAALYGSHRLRLRRQNRIAGTAARETLQDERRPGAAALRFILWTLAAVLLIVALAGPAWNPVEETVERHGREVVFLLDVSRSMLAQDLRPSRLERAKADITDCVEGINGDRVALVAFAGKAAVQCPLTQDYGFFRMQLADTSPASVSRGGTNLGDAIRVVQEQLFNGGEEGVAHRDVILITDGEDHGSFPVEAAKKLGADGVRLIAIGIGDENAGTPIELTDESGRRKILEYQGEVVRSKLDAKTLREMAAATPGGVYLPMGTNAMDLRKIYRQLVDQADKSAFEEEKIVTMEPKYQIFLGAAMLLMFMAELLPRGRRRALAVLLMLFSMQLTEAQQVTNGAEPDPAISEAVEAAPKDQAAARKAFKAGRTAYEKGDYAAAAEAYKEAEAQAEDGLKYIMYNQGCTALQQADFAAAKEAFNAAATYNDQADDGNGDDHDFAARCASGAACVGFNLARSHLQAQKLQEASAEIEAAYSQGQKAARLKPEDEQIAQNLHHIKMLRKRILQLMKEQQQQQQQDQQNQQQEQNQENQNQQNQQQKKNQEQQQEQQQDQQNQENQEQQNQQQEQNQEQNQDQQQDQQNQKNQEQQNQQQDQQNQENQEQQKQNQDQQQDQQNQENQEHQEQQDQASEEKEPEEKASQEQAQLDRELQRLIDNEKMRRLQKRREQSRQMPVEKDW